MLFAGMGWGKKKILIVDDDATVRELLVDIFSEKYEIIEAVDGQEAIELAKSKAPDLILLDYNMPGLSGLDVIRQLRAYDQTKETPIVMVTSQSSLGAVEVLLKSGATDYVTKPFDIGKFRKKVEGLLASA